MEKVEINNLVSKSLGSIAGIKPAKPDEFLFGRVMTGISEKEKMLSQKKFYSGYVWKLAVAFVIIAMLNIFSLIDYSGIVSSGETASSGQDIESFMSEYHLNNSIYYY
jgi:hypothetical protein